MRPCTSKRVRESSHAPPIFHSGEWTWDAQNCANTFTTDRGPPTLAMSIAGSKEICPPLMYRYTIWINMAIYVVYVIYVIYVIYVVYVIYVIYVIYTIRI